ncbi:MAG: response regulator [Gammaproteobacteria bacterium]|nr:response regulator [Gammaproteobacteria bacterium]
MVESNMTSETEQQAQLFVNRNAEILEMIATGQSASSIYDAIALMYEARHPGLRCSLLELKGNLLMHGGAPSLPKEYCDAVNGLKNGPNVGSCGTSTYTGKTVLVEDIATDPKWADIKHVALPHGMRSCWSQPIKSSNGKVLGALGMYYNHPALPNNGELADLTSAARLAGIVMERDQREIELRQSDQRFRSLFDKSPDPAWIIDEHHFVECNAAAVVILGYDSKDDLLNTDPLNISPTHQPDGELSCHKAKDMMNAAMEKGLHRFEWLHLRKDGSVFFAEVTLSPILLQQRPVMYCTWRDITARKTTEENNARLQTELQQSQKMDSLGQFSGGIAHDFNNLLNVIIGYTDLALKNRITQNESKLIGYLSKVNSAAERAANLVSQLLLFSRMDQVKPVPMKLAPKLNEDLAMLRATLPSTIKIDIEAEENLPAVMLDPTQLQQLVMNLCINARDAMDGQGEISIRLAWAKDLDIKSAVTHKPIKGDWIELAVNDTGSGIAPEIVKDIFTPFFTTKEVGKGTGMGLAVVFGIMEKNSGHVLVEAGACGGTTIRLLFAPVTEVPLQEEIVNSQTAVLPDGQGENILVVDDEKSIASLLCELLVDYGYQPTVAFDGAEALALFQENPDKFRMLITDQTMPKITGTQLITQLREIQRGLPVILCTGFSDKINEEEAKRENIKFFNKPVDYDELIQATALMLNPG